MDVQQRSRINVSTVVRRLEVAGCAAAIAAAMGVSESTISRMKNDHLSTFAQVLAHAGLKIVPADMKCYAPDKIDALLTLAKAHMDQLKNVDQLVWGDEQ